MLLKRGGPAFRSPARLPRAGSRSPRACVHGLEPRTVDLLVSASLPPWDNFLSTF